MPCTKQKKAHSIKQCKKGIPWKTISYPIFEQVADDTVEVSMFQYEKTRRMNPMISRVFAANQKGPHAPAVAFNHNEIT